MPHVKDHKHHSKKHQAHDQGEKPEGVEEMNARAKRRPGREEPEASDAEVKVVDVEKGEVADVSGSNEEEVAAAAAAASNGNGSKSHSKAEPEVEASFEGAEEVEGDESKKIEINFPGSELIRSKFPQPFEMAEKVATDWMNNGDFSDLPIKQPLAQFAAQKGLQRAKEIEKKVLESPTTEKVAMQVLTVGFKAQGLFEQIRSKLKKGSE